jgi:hypothetical protein
MLPEFITCNKCGEWKLSDEERLKDRFVCPECGAELVKAPDEKDAKRETILKKIEELKKEKSTFGTSMSRIGQIMEEIKTLKNKLKALEQTGGIDNVRIITIPELRSKERQAAILILIFGIVLCFAGFAFLPFILIGLPLTLWGIGRFLFSFGYTPMFNRLEGPCPYCGTILQATSKQAGITCRGCLKRILIRENRFIKCQGDGEHRMNQHGYAQRIQSLNGVYILAWSDDETTLTRTGKYRQQKGDYALFENGDLILSGKLQRPNDGKVANNGNFIFNDWMFQTHEKGTFYAIDRDGGTLIRKQFKANLFRNELSFDGKFAVCQTANSDNDDGATLTFFDLKARKILWQCHPPDWGTDSYEFDTDKEILYLKYQNGRIFRYSFSGEFLDAE